jgi:hypothetical protein
MPLQAGSSREVISANIRDMIHAGHPQNQAVAAALRNARETPHRAMGGIMGVPHVGVGMNQTSGLRPVTAAPHHMGIHLPSMLPRRDDGGQVPAQPTPGLNPSTSTAGPMAQNYIQRFQQMSPEQLQEMVARLGNSPMAGIAQRVLQAKRITPDPVQATQTAQATPLSPGGMQGQAQPQLPTQQQYGGMQPVQQQARGGETKPKKETVPILAAGMEFVVAPHHVARWGGGDIEKGHREFDKFVIAARKQIIKEMSKLRPPVGSEK